MAQRDRRSSEQHRKKGLITSQSERKEIFAHQRHVDGKGNPNDLFEFVERCR